MKLDGIIIDRVFDAIVEKFDETEILARICQISEGSIETTSETVDKTDAQGVLIKRIPRSKAVSVSLTNALLDMNIMGVSTGSGKVIAGENGVTFDAPMVKIYKAAEEVELDFEPKADTPFMVYAVNDNGSLGAKFEAGAGEASATEYALSEKTLKLPTAEGVTRYLVKYTFTATENVGKIEQLADKFPETVKLTLTVLGYDECKPDTLRKYYIIFPSFQPSADSTITLSTDSTFDFSGDAQVKYCDVDKMMYYIIAAEDDIEE